MSKVEFWGTVIAVTASIISCICWVIVAIRLDKNMQKNNEAFKKKLDESIEDLKRRYRQ